MEATLTLDEFVLGRSAPQPEAAQPWWVQPPRMFTRQNTTGLMGTHKKREMKLWCLNNTTRTPKIVLLWLIEHVHIETTEIGLWYHWCLLTFLSKPGELKEASWAAVDEGSSSSVISFSTWQEALFKDVVVVLVSSHKLFQMAGKVSIESYTSY